MSISIRSILNLLIFVLLARYAQGQTTWHVDENCAPPGTGTEVDPFCTIQDGVNASFDGDTVLVGPGTYIGAGNRDISLFGKRITVKSTNGPSLTVMDIEGSPSAIHGGFFLNNGETQDTVIEGFTITNGYLVGDTGGSGFGGGAGGGGGAAIFIRESSPTIRDCILKNNTAASIGAPFPADGRGGAVYVDENSQVIFEHCIIANNVAERGGGLHGSSSSQVTIRNCLVIGNVSDENNFGGGMNAGRYATIVNTTVAYNTSGGPAGGLSVGRGSLITNCTIWGNQAAFGGDQVTISDSQAHLDPVLIEYNNIEGGLAGIAGDDNRFIWGSGNIDAHPLFVDPENEDFRLLHGSPCVDAADNLAVPEGVSTDLDGDPRFLDDPTTPDTGNPDPDDPKLPIVDMGPYEYDPDDCNNNDIPDTDDLANGTSIDCDENAIPDDCELDCNNNGQVDACDVTQGLSDDCNGNLIPDECELDCNDNGQQDDCDITDGVSDDCDANGVPDECDPDCNDNGAPDACDIADGFSHDCDDDNIPDECDPGPPIIEQPADAEVQAGDFVIFSVQADGVVLFYQWRKDGVDLIDTDRIVGTMSPGLFIFDVRPLDAGAYDCVVTDLFGPICTTSEAAALTVLTDCPADFDGNGAVGPFDLAILLGNWGPNPNHPADLDADGTVGPPDLALLLGNWGPCE